MSTNPIHYQLYKLLAIFHKRLLDAVFISIVYNTLLSKRQWEDRSRGEIASQILEIAKHGSGYTSNGQGGATKTSMMYNTFLNHDQLKEFITVLIESDLLSYDSTIHNFKTTEKGITFLQAYKQIDHMLKEQQIQMKHLDVLKLPHNPIQFLIEFYFFSRFCLSIQVWDH